MKTHFALALTLTLAACTTPTESPAVTLLPPATVEQSVSATLESLAVAPTFTETLQPVPQATSRGAQLVASDPVTAQVGAGKPVLLEFFRFT